MYTIYIYYKFPYFSHRVKPLQRGIFGGMFAPLVDLIISITAIQSLHLAARESAERCEVLLKHKASWMTGRPTRG